MTLADLKSYTSRLLDDLNYGYFTEAQITQWLNLGQKEVQSRLILTGQNYYQICVMTTLIVNQREYILPLDFKKDHRLELIMSGVVPNESTSKIYPVTTNQLRDFVTPGVGTPEAYDIKRNRLVLMPAPDTARVMRLYYSYQIPDMTLDSDVPDVPDAYQELIGLHAVKKGFLKDTRIPDLITAEIAKYEEYMDRDANERRQDAPRTIVETGLSSEGGYFF